MGKFGKKNEVSSDLSNYMLGIIGPSGFGKSTLMYQTCDKLYGDEGYIILDIGAENGIAAIAGAVSEHVPTYATLNEIVMDIVKNKATDYPNLKVVVIDTLDAYFEIIEEYVIKDWNITNSGNQNFVKAKSINSVEGGFGRGMDRVIDVAKKVISRLNSVGVGVWWTAHVKEKDQSDLYTGATYTQLTANMSKKYFDSVKNSSHVVACGYIDRAIEKIEVGEENPVTKKKKQRNAVIDEVRKIKFRDDMLVADAKSRFANIIAEIPLDTNAFIKAISDAIKAAQKSSPAIMKASTSVQQTPINVIESKIESSTEEIDDVTIVEDEEYDVTKAVSQIRQAFKELPKETKVQIKNLKGDSDLEDLSPNVLEQILHLVQVDTEIID